MTATQTAIRTPHIAQDSRGIAYVEGTHTKVMTIVQNKRASRCTPEQLQAAMPHLPLAQVYAALAFYHDHRAEVDRQIRAAHRKADSIRQAQPPAPTRSELRARLSEFP